MADSDKRFLGGGRLYGSILENGTYGEEFEIGEIQEATLTPNDTFAEAYSYASGTETKTAKLRTKKEANFAFKTNEHSGRTLAMSMMAKQGETKVYAIGDTLPDGTVAAAETTANIREGGSVSNLEMKLRFVGKNVASKDSDPVLEIPLASVTPDGNTRSYIMTKEFGKLSFKCEILQVEGEPFYNEIDIPKAGA